MQVKETIKPFDQKLDTEMQRERTLIFGVWRDSILEQAKQNMDTAKATIGMIDLVLSQIKKIEEYTNYLSMHMQKIIEQTNVNYEMNELSQDLNMNLVQAVEELEKRLK